MHWAEAGLTIGSSGTLHCHEHWDSIDGELVRPPWQLTLRYTMPQDLETLLHYNGFKVVARYSDYKGDPISQEEPGYIYLCQKR